MPYLVGTVNFILTSCFTLHRSSSSTIDADYYNIVRQLFGPWSAATISCLSVVPLCRSLPVVQQRLSASWQICTRARETLSQRRQWRRWVDVGVCVAYLQLLASWSGRFVVYLSLPLSLTIGLSLYATPSLSPTLYLPVLTPAHAAARYGHCHGFHFASCIRVA